MRCIQVVGRKKSGKTALLESLLPQLRRRGLRVGTVKHSSHPHPLDRPKSDSWRHREAGALATLVITAVAGSYHFELPTEEPEVEGLVERFLGGMDLVLMEGWASYGAEKIEVLPPDSVGNPKPPRVTPQEGLIALVLGPGVKGQPAQVQAEVPVFKWKQTQELTTWLLGHLHLNPDE